MRLSTGSAILRGDLRLEQQAERLTGSVALESSDGPPVAIRDGRIEADGTIEFSLDAPGVMRFTGQRTGGGLTGLVALDLGRSWRWTAERLPPGAEFYAALPRFRAVQLLLGRDAAEIRLPGAWIEAAGREPGVAARADDLAIAAGLTPIPAESIHALAFLPSMGLARRDQLGPAMVRALEAIRADLPPGEQRRFDAIFRPRGQWLIDLHAAALDGARRRFRTLDWTDAHPALAAAGLLPTNMPAGVSIVPLALYRLAVLRERDSVAYEGARNRLAQGGNASAQRAEALLDGYRDAAPWQGQAVTFLLSANWVQAPGGRTSPAGLMRASWGRPDLPVPAIRPRYFGIPEAVPRVGTPADAVGRIVIPENWVAEQWAARRGPGGLLAVLHRLRLQIGVNTVIDAESPWMLTSVAAEATSTPAGFLESANAILEDPGSPPLFAVATALHEWQHLLMESHRLSLRTGGALVEEETGLRYAASNLFLAEGFAEWATERLLAPVLARTPMLGVGDAQKLSVLESGNPADPHVLGLQMMRALAAALDNAAELRPLVLAHGDAPAAVAAAASGWQGDDIADLVLPARSQRRLIPETTFTIEDGVGDVIGMRILVVADSTPRR